MRKQPPMIGIRQLRKLLGRRIADMVKLQPVRLDLFPVGCPDSARSARHIWIAYRHAGMLGVTAGEYELLPAESFDIDRTFNGLYRRRPAVSVTADDFRRADLNILYLGV